ncbi:MAG: 2Fe-2S iron-sulfur cluster-binding protein, partial [Microcoleaceae cyanobacterium]
GANLKPGIDLSAIPSGNLQVTVAEETKPAIPASIVLLKSEKIIDCTENDLILDAIEKVGVDLRYSCRSGTCGTCVQKIVSGKVKYDTDLPALKGLASDEILTCSASPIGQVVIDA